MTAPLLVLSGPPGSGKTTVAALLAERFERSAHILGDHFFRYIRGGWQDPSSPEANEQNSRVISISAEAAAGYAQAGYTTVLDGIYGPWFLNDVQAAASGLPVHYVVLRADLETALQRTSGRSDTRADDGLEHRNAEDLERVVRKMHGEFDQLAQYERFVIDTSHAAPQDVTETVFTRFEAGEFLLS